MLPGANETASVRAPASARSAIGLLRVLLVCSLLIPALLLGVTAWLSYRDATARSIRDLRRSSEVAREQAAKVFDSQSQAADRINDLVRGMDSDAIARSEKPLHEAFAAIIARLPQVRSVLLADAAGRPLVSALIYPIPAGVNVSGTDYFQAVVGGQAGTYVSGLQTGLIIHQPFFGAARPWTDARGNVRGVIDVAVSPSSFEEFYAVLVGEGEDGDKGKVVTLVRDDGEILVRYPPILAAPPRIDRSGEFFNAIEAQPTEGVYEGRSVVEAGVDGIFAYRKVQGYPLYVVAGRSRNAILAGWRRTMAGHLGFGIPVTLALFAITWTALVRTRREQEALVRANQEIERRQQAETALLKAQRLEAVGQVTGGVAHDFNNLLTVILGSSEMLSRRADDPDRVRHVAGQIALAAKRGGEVIQQLLAFSRRQLVKPETINLNRCLEEFRQLLERAAQEAVRIEFDLDVGLDPVRLDPGHFEAAILNLVGNARDAMPDGGRITIATRNIVPCSSEHPELSPGAYVQVAVSDTGSGMDARTLAKAFEPFFTTKEVGQGTGLGLSQVYGFAKQAGGDARIITAQGRGTTIELLLPRAEKREPAERAGPQGVPLRRASAGEVVLVVEDEPDVLVAAVESLRDLGYATFTAKTAQAALDRLRGEDRVDVLFSDVVMPGGMNGLQLSIEARRLRPDLKVLLTSGYTAGFGREQTHDVPLLTKPYDRNQLAAHLRTVLHG